VPEKSDSVTLGEVPPEACPHVVGVAVNVHRWEDISFLHWRFDPGVVQRLLPDGVNVLAFDGAAWVGVTPFFIRVRPLGIPIGLRRFAFPETNLRTYVSGPDGRQGIVFLRMEVAARWFVVALRSVGLPYVFRAMSVERVGEVTTYRSRPRARTGVGGHDIVVRPERELHRPHGELERFLTARWAAFHEVGPVILRTPVEHPPWPLWTASVERCDVAALFGSAGLPPPAGHPVVHWSPGVTVKVGPPTLPGARSCRRAG
jgi:uncharacterized protein YqjF (DUF2071 family)